MASKRPFRESARALVMTPDTRLLLLHYRDPRGAGRRWLTPGGGVDPGESPVVCVRRELSEETGLVDFEVGAQIWRRSVVFRRIQFREHFFLIETGHFDPDPRRMGRKERSLLLGFQWWSLDEIHSSPAKFEPAGMVGLVSDLLERGAPSRPRDIGR